MESNKQENNEKQENKAVKEGKEKYFDENGNEISKSQWKFLEKQKKQEEEKKKKEQEKLKKDEGKPKTEKSEKVEEDPTKYFENRMKWLQNEKNSGKNPFPHKFEVTYSLPKLKNEFYDKTTKGEFIMDKSVSVAGRVYNIRYQGNNLIFFDIISDDVRVQIYTAKQFYLNSEEGKSLKEQLDHIKRGDFIGVKGNVGRTTGGETGEFSVRCVELLHLSYCLHMLPRPEMD